MRFFFDAYVFDTDRRELRHRGTLVPLTPQMFDLLGHLLRNRERVVSKDELVSIPDDEWSSYAKPLTDANYRRNT